MPPVYWMTVGMVLNTAYERAAEEIPPDMDLAEYVINSPDYGGFVNRRYGVRNPGRAAIVVIGEDSNMAGPYQGERPVEAVLEVLETSWDTPRVLETTVTRVCWLQTEARNCGEEDSHRQAKTSATDARPSEPGPDA